MVRVRLRIAMTEEEVISSGLQSSSFMLQTMPAADQAVRKRKVRLENNIRTWKYWLVSPQKRMMKRPQMVRPWILSHTGMGLS